MDGEHYRPSTKEKDFRILPLSVEVMEALKLLPRSISGFVFTYNGKPLRKGLVNSTWRAAAKKAGIDVCCYQGTRHSVASQLVNDGTSLELISKLLGHKTGVSTRRYAHVNGESLRDLVDRQQTVSSNKKRGI
jgi:integrase